MAKLYWTANGTTPTTAPLTKVASGTVTTTMLQVATTSTKQIGVVEWGFSFDGDAAATPVQCELFYTSTAATSMNSGVIWPFNDPNAPAAGETATYWKSGQAEGTATSLVYGDLQQIAPSASYLKQFPLDREFWVPTSSYLRTRFTAGASVNMYVYINYVVLCPSLRFRFTARGGVVRAPPRTQPAR